MRAWGTRLSKWCKKGAGTVGRSTPRTVPATVPAFSNPKAIVFRLGAVIAGLVPLVLAELLLSMFGVGAASDVGDPYVDFQSERPLFQLNSEETRYEIPKERQGCFRPESFPAQKTKNGFRIFCLGGSTVQGRPFAIETSFTTWLELSLRAADPSRDWDVVNCGGISYASYRLVPILEEIIANYDPNLIIVYTGHNEFLEDRTYGRLLKSPRVLRDLTSRMGQLRTFRLLRDHCRRMRGSSSEDPRASRPILTEEVEALLDYKGGLEHYHRDRQWQRAVVEHFRFNLQRMVRLCREARVPIYLVNPVCNLRDCPPFKSQHRDDLTAADLERWNALRDEASTFYRDNMRKAIELLDQAMKLDDQHAGLHYDLAKSYEAIGLLDKARDYYLRAKEEDICPLRIIEALNQAVIWVARAHIVPMIDVRAVFDQESRDGIPGGFLLVDHVHPSIPGHQLIARLFIEEFAKNKIVQPVAGWQQERDELYQSHTDSLDEGYYLLGQQRLENLRGWAHGRSTHERSKE